MKWVHLLVLTLKKSRFKGFCAPIAHRDEIPTILELLRAHEKALKKATHPYMYAFRIGTPEKGGTKVTDQGLNDDGEGGAGNRILGVLERLDLVNVIVVVSRWYGGTPLGPARFRCISDVAIEAIERMK